MNGVYKAKINKMQEDEKENFEFKVFKECKCVREKLLYKYGQLSQSYKTDMEVYMELSI